jgi:3'-5' exoribonuclease
VMTAQKIREKASAISGFPALLEHHITHIVLAHHGQLEYGSPKLPMTLEALLVHLIDTVDSRVQSWLEIMAKDSHPNWTDVSKLYDRHLWKGPSPTARHRSPVEGRARRKDRDGERKPRTPPQGPKPAREEPPHGKAAADSTPEAPAAEMSFRPLAELAGDAPGSGNGSSS